MSRQTLNRDDPRSRFTEKPMGTDPIDRGSYCGPTPDGKADIWAFRKKGANQDQVYTRQDGSWYRQNNGNETSEQAIQRLRRSNERI